MDQNELTQGIEIIKKRFEPDIEAIKQKAQKLQDDFKKPGAVAAVINVDFKVDWKDVELSFDLPSVTVKDQNISLDLPEVSSSTQHIAFDVPDVRMVDRKVGEYPEVHGWTIKWKPIIVSVPEPYMRRVDISLDLPSVTMRRKDFVLGIPQFSMERFNFVVTLPQFTLLKVSAEIDKIKAGGEALQAEGEDLARRMKSEIDVLVAQFTSGAVAAAFAAKNEVSNSFNQALGTVRGAIDVLSSQGCDPIKVPTPGGDVNLRKIYDDIDATKSRSLSTIDASGAMR